MSTLDSARSLLHEPPLYDLVEKIGSLLEASVDGRRRTLNVDWGLNDVLADRVADLASGLDQWFGSHAAASDGEEQARIQIRDEIDHVFSLMGSPLRPAASSDIIRVEFHRFVRNLARHETEQLDVRESRVNG